MTSLPIADGGGRHHGEYKVPGGKLVVVDLDVVDGRLAHVSAQRRLLPRTGRGARRSTGLSPGCPSTRAPPHRRRHPRPCPKMPCCSAFPPRPSPSPCAAPWPRPPAGWTTTGRSSARRPAHPRQRGPGRGAHRGGRRRPAQPDPALLGLGRALRGDRQLPVGAQRTRPRGRGAARHQRGAPHQRRRRHVHGGRQLHHLLALPAADPRGRHELRGLVQLPGRLGDGRAGDVGISAFYVPLNDIATELARSAAPRRSASPTAACCTT